MTSTGPLPMGLICCDSLCAPVGCWACPTRPDTVAISGGTGCCTEPNGTFTLEAASGGGYQSFAFFEWNDTTHKLDYTAAELCSWSWDHDRDSTFSCTAGDRYCVALCDSKEGDDESALNQWRVYVNNLSINIAYRTALTNRIRVVIERYYNIIRCTGSLVVTARTSDVYMPSSTPSCGSLPATINHTARYVQWTDDWKGGAGTTDVPLTYGYNSATSTYDKYSFSMCSAIPSVSLTYV